MQNNQQVQINFGLSDRSVLMKKLLHFLADLWSQSEIRTQQQSLHKTRSKMKWPNVYKLRVHRYFCA